MERHDTPALRTASPTRPEARPAPRVKLPPQRYLDYPADVSRKQALRALLAETDLFGGATAEAEAYLDCALERFRVTMALLPPLGPEAQILELGANPYFLTRLLRRRGLEVRAANWFGEGSGFGAEGCQRVVESGLLHEYHFDHFNIETATFPYADSSFDLVLFCEILEHLPCDPTHTLVEIHRVLREGGTLLLTTPNANRLENLVKVQRGENMYESLSGYGVYGRHNREYTLTELCDLLDGCGYDVDDVFARDIWQRPSPPVLVPGIDLENRGENLFALATARATFRWYYPSWLYQSVHGYRRAVRPDLLVGVNCDIQAWGLHKLETFDGKPGRWTDGAAETVVLLAPVGGGPGVLRVEGRSSEIGGTMELRARTNREQLSWTVPCDGHPFVVESEVHADPGPQTVELSSDRIWRPCDSTTSLDPRILGFVLHRVSMQPYFGQPIRPDVVVGINCEVQLYGAHAIEEVHGCLARWTDGSRKTVALLAPESSGEALLRIEGWTPNLGGELEIRAETGGKQLSWSLPADGDPFVVTTEVGFDPGEQVVHLWSDRPWSPSEERGESDRRQLGFLLRTVALDSPARVPDEAPQHAPVPTSPKLIPRLVRVLRSQLRGRGIRSAEAACR